MSDAYVVNCFVDGEFDCTLRVFSTIEDAYTYAVGYAVEDPELAKVLGDDTEKFAEHVKNRDYKDALKIYNDNHRNGEISQRLLVTKVEFDDNVTEDRSIYRMLRLELGQVVTNYELTDEYDCTKDMFFNGSREEFNLAVHIESEIW